MDGKVILKDGIFIQEKIFENQKCGTCRNPLFLQVFRYDNKLHKIIICKNCQTYHLIKEKKPYIEFQEK